MWGKQHPARVERQNLRNQRTFLVFCFPGIDSETFDLAGQNEATITHTISQAFSEPFPLNEMIRLTFIVGAGKLGRQKYDDNAAKAVTAALRTLDFQEDHGASCVIECAGKWILCDSTFFSFFSLSFVQTFCFL